MRKFKKHNPIGKEELKSASKVIKSGILSDFIADETVNFYGGKNVRRFENFAKKYFKTKYAISVNSWTSGLTCAVGALDIYPGDEVIVTPFTMAASVTSIIHWNAIPIFCDIEEETFNLDPEKVESKITSKTKAIMLVDICGHPVDIDKFKKIAKKHNLKLIVDSAQSIGAKYLKTGKYSGTVGDVGGFSFNCHKHINTGEGGLLVTNNSEIARKLYLIRNHGEQVIKSKQLKKLYNVVGYNFRMGEIEAAIAIEQLKKLKKIIKKKQNQAKRIIDGVKMLKGLYPPKINKNVTHSFYNMGFKIGDDINRNKVIKLLKKEGVPCNPGYLNIHRLPMFKKKIAYGKNNFPWSLNKKKYDFQKCEIAEKMHNKNYFGVGMCSFDFTERDIDYIISKFHKVWSKIKKK